MPLPHKESRSLDKRDGMRWGSLVVMTNRSDRVVKPRGGTAFRAR